ncbi:DNA polymerase IV [Thiospirochaeta perfilievii]|uniref:DNA polymerase IV n=1 Tax=Thiospirochaeta perfilievii TaxID=252967 RepID=A0A5C1QBC8_9SPIO|nr:DNA polymerase IV [Thiospirochaeta perfilievii]QEN03964.1 DNA polymerase IV [Thiospirochaeta perfilievii]
MALKKIIHVDMDAFFAAVEQRDHPEYRGKPLIIGGDPKSRGVVSTCSYEARKYGIHSAMPTATAYKLCPQGIFVGCNFERIKEASTQVHEIFHKYTDIVEPLSLDEAYLDVTNNKIGEPSATKIAQMIRRDIYQKTKLTASAGVSYNKFIAKVASDFNKPNGITVVPPEKASEFILNLPIRKFWGVGKVTEKKMLKLGIKTGHDLIKYKRYELIELFGKSGPFFYDIVRGIDNREVETHRIRKSIGRENTFKEDILDSIRLIEFLESVATRVETDLKKEGKKALTITLKVTYHDFTKITRSITAPTYIYRAKDIILYIKSLIPKTLIGQKAVRLLGISTSNFQGEEEDKYGLRQYWLPFKPEEIAPRIDFL